MINLGYQLGRTPKVFPHGTEQVADAKKARADRAPWAFSGVGDPKDQSWQMQAS